MPTFISFVSWTDQGIRNIKQAPDRLKDVRALMESMGGRITQAYLTSGANDMVVIIDVPNGDVMAKFALTVGAQGNVRTQTVRAWPEAEMEKFIAEIP